MNSNYQNTSNIIFDRTFELNKLNGTSTMLKDRNLLNDRNLFNNQNIMEKKAPNNNNNNNNNKNFGEITGESYNVAIIDKGMPMRSNYDIFKKKINNKNEHNHGHTDFNLYDEINDNFNVSYYDPNGGNMFDFNEITKKKIMKNSDSLELMNTVINDYNWYMLDNIINLMNTSTLYSSIGIINLMASIYIGSKNKTQDELINYFNFPERQTVFDGLRHINANQKSLSHSNTECINIKNIIITNNKDISEKYVNHIKELAIIYNINSGDEYRESNKLNEWLNKIYGNVLGNILNPDHIKKMDMSCLCVGTIRTIWKIPFDKTLIMNFNGKKIREEKFMCNNNKSYNYYENDVVKIIELPLDDNINNMGIIISKNDKFISNICAKEIELYISEMHITNINRVIIPFFHCHSRMRISSIFKKTGLNNLFYNMEIPELSKDDSILSDVIQNIHIIVNNNYKNMYYDTNVKSNKIVDNFIANKSFIYYFRCVKTNTITVSGLYY